MLPYLTKVCLALGLVTSERAGVVTHRITCGYAAPTLPVVQQEGQEVVAATRRADEGSCSVEYLSIVIYRRHHSIWLPVFALIW